MSKLYRTFVSFVMIVMMVSCTAPAIPPSPKEMDVRGQNLSLDDYSARGSELHYATFDTRTKWPSADKLPKEFDPVEIMELGKDPGLGVRQLHEQGINGQGISIAIIDQPLLIDHLEYKDQLRLYEEVDNINNEYWRPAMHASAVSSIAVGKTVGVAPQADLYYIAAWTGDWEASTGNFTYNFKHYANAVHRVLEINQDLSQDQKIRVIAMQVGWSPDQAGYDEITAAVSEAREAGIFVVSSSLSETYGLHFHGMGRKPTADPNAFQSYEPGLFWQSYFYLDGIHADTLLIPMDSRTTASEQGNRQYVFYREGGWSWSIPYIAGMYALATQVKPDVTPELFWETALQTGKTIQLQHDGKEFEFGVILDPQALIKALQSK